MDNRALHNILIQQRTEIDRKLTKHVIDRELLSKARKSINSELITVITGVRRCGKSIFAHQLLQDKKYAYINFDDERLGGLSTEQLNDVFEVLLEIQPNVHIFLFDEIQNILRWELFVNRLQRQGYKIVVTGSNANLLSTELSTHLTGRHLTYNLYPFSFREYVTYTQVHVQKEYTTQTIALYKRALQEYMMTGGVPLAIQQADVYEYLRALYQDILITDIALRHQIRQLNELKELSLYVLMQSSSRITYRKLEHVFNLRSAHTIKQYINYLEEAFLIFQIDSFSFKLKHVIRSPKKIYTIDHGMIQALSQQNSQDMGKIMENIVYVELLRRNQGLIYYYQTKDNKEVDFVVTHQKTVQQIIQVCYQLNHHTTKEREVSALLQASDELSCNTLLVITFDLDKEEKHGKKTILYIPLWRWLIENKSSY